MRKIIGAVHPNTGNFDRSLRWNIVARMRKLIATGLYKR
jgi:hypothetical protein